MGLFGINKKPNRERINTVRKNTNNLLSETNDYLEETILGDMNKYIKPYVNVISKVNLVLKKGSEVLDNDLIDKLEYSPNEVDSLQDILEKLVTNYKLYNNAYIIIDRDTKIYNENSINSFSKLKVITDYKDVKLIKSKNGNILYEFNMKDKNGVKGTKLVKPLNDVIHIKSDFIFNEYLGSSPQETIGTELKTINRHNVLNYDIIENAINPKYIIQAKSQLGNDTLKDLFNEKVFNLREIIKKTGFIPLDSTMDLKQLTQYDNYKNDSEKIKDIQQVVMNYFGVNESILSNQFSEEEWNSFYEIQVLPIVKKISIAFTNAFIPFNLYKEGYRIEVDTSNVTYSTMDTKITYSSLVGQGIITPNEARKWLGLQTVKTGDKIVRRKDTGVVDEETGEFVEHLKNGK